MTKARDLSKLLSTANGKIEAGNVDIPPVSFENIVDTGTAGTKVASGTTEQRGSTTGQIRFNTTTGLAEYYTGSEWKYVDTAPTITSVSPSEVDSQAGGNVTIIITGVNFSNTPTVLFLGNAGTNITPSIITRNSSTQITTITPKNSFLNAQEPYSVKVTNITGLSSTLNSQINVDSSPLWTTSSGNIADIGENATGTHATVTATDFDGDTISYSETGGTVLSSNGLTLNSSTGEISGDPTDVANDTTLNFYLRATANTKTSDRLFNIIVRNVFTGGNQSVASIEALAKDMLASANNSSSTGGTLTVNGLSLGSYDWYKTSGATTISSFSSETYFTGTQDTRSSFLIFNGNLTINSGQTFIPSNRKLFTCIYVNGNLTVNGTISMTGRGANHSSGAGNVTKQNIKLIASGTYSGVTDPQIPASGGAGAAGNSAINASRTGNAGTAGTAGGAGGGGSGGTRSNSGNPASTGTGAGGTSFSGGSGSGGSWGVNTATSPNAEEDGGAGGAGGTNEQSSGVFGGAGNPVGSASGTGSGDQSTDSGTGGILVIYCTGTFSGTGAVEARGKQGGWRVGYTTSDGSRGTSGGGGSGGGSINIFYGTDSSSITPSASGGAGGNTTGQCASGTCNGGAGGAGGAGTARKLSITAS